MWPRHSPIHMRALYLHRVCMCVWEQSVPGSGPQGECCRGQYSRIKWYYPKDNLPKCPWLWLLYIAAWFDRFPLQCVKRSFWILNKYPNISFRNNHHNGYVRMYTNMCFVDVGYLALWSCWHSTGSCPTQHARTQTLSFMADQVSVMGLFYVDVPLKPLLNSHKPLSQSVSYLFSLDRTDIERWHHTTAVLEMPCKGEVQVSSDRWQHALYFAHFWDVS